MTILKAIIKNKIILAFIIGMCCLFFTILLFFLLMVSGLIEHDNYEFFNSLLSSIISLLAIMVALLLPIVIKDIDKKDEKEKISNIRQKCYNALNNICNKYFEYYNDKNGNAENFPIKELGGIISSLSVIKEFKRELFDLDMSYSEVFRKEDPNAYFKYIFIEKEVRIYMQMEYNTPLFISIEKNGVKVKNRTGLNQILAKIKNNINK